MKLENMLKSTNVDLECNKNCQKSEKFQEIFDLLRCISVFQTENFDFVDIQSTEKSLCRLHFFKNKGVLGPTR